MVVRNGVLVCVYVPRLKRAVTRSAMLELGEEPRIYLVDDLHVARQQALEDRHSPAAKRQSKEGKK